MTPDPNAAHLRTLRKRSGLSQKEVAHILGSCSGAAVSRHERSNSLPDLLTALGYEAIFKVSISELFPGLYRTVEAGIEDRIAALEDEFHQSSVKGRSAIPIAVKLEFFEGRKNGDSTHPAP
jgi:transcriptional regulator with XRE-family HTH domain